MIEAIPGKAQVRFCTDPPSSCPNVSVELVLASGVADSVSTLSYPYTNELVNSFIKDCVYSEFGTEDSESFSALGVIGALGATCDFRKHLHAATPPEGEDGSLPWCGILWGCECRFKSYPGTRIRWISLDKFDINEFKLVNISPFID